MKININHKTRMRLAATVACILLLVLILYGISALPATPIQDGIKDGIAKEQSQQSEVDAAQKSAFLDSQTNQKAAEPQPIPTSNNSISLAAEQSQETVSVTSKLQGFASGTCSLSITNGSRQYNSTVAILYQPEYSTCAGFSVPVSKLGVGLWNITLNVTPDGGSELTKTLAYGVH